MIIDHAPASPRSVVVMQHGFFRSPDHLEGIAAACVSRGMTVVRPHLPSLRPGASLQSRSYVQRFARHVCEASAELSPNAVHIVLGHSAGGAVVCAMLNSVPQMWAGAVFIDPVDKHALIHTWAWGSAGRPGLPVQVLAAPGSACNRRGAASADLLRSGRVDAGEGYELFGEVNHADIERVPADLRETSVRAPDRLARWACGPGGDAASVCALGRATVAAIEAIEASARTRGLGEE